MRKILLAAASLAAFGALAVPAQADTLFGSPHKAAKVAAVSGTVTGVGIHNHWWGVHGLGSSVGASTAFGVIAAAGTLVAYDLSCKTVGYDYLNLQLGNRCSWYDPHYRGKRG